MAHDDNRLTETRHRVMAYRPKKLISICIPVLNEEETLNTLYERLWPLLQEHEDRYDFELVFTDNHSTDGSYDILSQLAEEDHRIRVFRFSRNFGYQRSILTAYLKSCGDAVVQLDCDLQDPPELIFEFAKSWENGYDVVYGIRQTRDEGWAIQSARRVFYRVANYLSEDPLPIDAGDFRLVDRRVIRTLREIQDSQPYLRGAISAMGFRQLGIPYDRHARVAGTSKFAMKDLFSLAIDGILNHSTVPLRIATYIGLFVSLVTFLGVIVYVICKMTIGDDWPAGFATLATLTLGGIALNALFLGVIGEYLGRIYKQVKRGPLTIVESSIDRRDGLEMDADLSCGTVVEP